MIARRPTERSPKLAAPAALAAGLMTIGVLTWATLRTKEPEYQGRTVTGWLASAAAGEQSIPNDTIESLGSNAVPALIRGLQVRQEPFFLSALRGFLKDQLPPSFARTIHSPQSAHAARAHEQSARWLGALGSASAAAVPILANVVASDETEAAERAIETLRRLGPLAVAAVPQLVARAEPPHHSFLAARALVAISPGSNVMDRLSHEKEPQIALAGAIGSFLACGRINEALNLLTAKLPDVQVGSAARQLAADLGPMAGALSTQLALLLADPNPEVRREAAWGLGAIGVPPAGTTVSALIAALEREQYPEARSAILGALGHLGRAARAAEPELERLLHGDDEQTIQEARQALESIRAP